MNIQISEEQLKRIVSEKLVGKDRDLDKNKYFNSLLDKISASGYDSLTDNEKNDLISLSKGDSVDEPDNEDETSSDDNYDVMSLPKELDNDYYKLFVDTFPDGAFSINVDGEILTGEMGGANEPPYLRIYNNNDDESEFKILPFFETSNNEYKILVTYKGFKILYSLSIFPETIEEMQNFISKIKKSLGSVIKDVLRKINQNNNGGTI